MAKAELMMEKATAKVGKAKGMVGKVEKVGKVRM